MDLIHCCSVGGYLSIFRLQRVRGVPTHTDEGKGTEGSPCGYIVT